MSREFHEREDDEREPRAGAGACQEKATSLLLGAHLDGQLDPVKTIEVEEHLTTCEICRERLALDRAMRGSLKKAVKVSAPDDVRARMLAALVAETARQTAGPASEEVQGEFALDASPSRDARFNGSLAPASAGARRPSMLRHWRTMLPLASAAALVMAWGAAGKQPVVHGIPDTMVPAGLSDDLLRGFVAQHKHPLPPEQQDPKEVRRFERHIGVPVHVTQSQHARFVGGRLVPVQGGEHAAMLQYEMQQGNNVQRVTVFVYDPAKVQIGGANLAPRAVGTAQVRIGQTDGYSVAVRQQGGVGYTIASDTDPDSLANLVAVVGEQ